MKMLFMAVFMLCVFGSVALAESTQVVPDLPAIPPGYSNPELEKRVEVAEKKVREKMEKYGWNIVA